MKSRNPGWTSSKEGKQALEEVWEVPKLTFGRPAFRLGVTRVWVWESF